MALSDGVGIAPDWQSGGQGFKSPKLHLQNPATNGCRGLYVCEKNFIFDYHRPVIK